MILKTIWQSVQNILEIQENSKWDETVSFELKKRPALQHFTVVSEEVMNSRLL